MVKKIREELLISKSELAKKAGVSVLTIDRVEKGMSCRMATKRKIILALGYDLSDKDKIFPKL
ncbi:helix-turn-helix domain-containing protein [Thermodesulfobacteriota bacterium]